MTLANNTADQKKFSKEKGIKQPRMGSGMNKIPSVPLENAKASDKKDDKPGIELIDKAKKLFTAAAKVEETNRKEAVDDLKFLNSEQWSAADAATRAAEGRPCLTENRLLTFANQITNDQRQNRPAIVISPMGDKTSKKAASIMRGMIRAIERDSHADVAYDTGFQSAVHGGWGYWRIVTEFEGDKSFNKVIAVRPIANPMTVYLDPARTQFGIDAKWAIITEMMPKAEFEKEYPERQSTPWNESAIGDSDQDWFSKDGVRVAEFYYFESEPRELVMLDNGHEGWEDELSEAVKDDIKSGSVTVEARRTVNVDKLKWAKMTALEVLDTRDCDGHYIPIVECVGTMLNINGKSYKKGIVRDAKGAQRMLNYYSTLETENVALQPKAPWIMEEGQVEGHEDKWQNANKKNFSYLLYKGTAVNGTPAPPPQRQAFQGPPQAILAAKQGAQEALKAITGIRFDATMSERMQDESGRAIRELNRNANLGAYHFIDNFGRALRNTGDILIDLIPYVYDTKRIVSILDETGAEDRVVINPHMSTSHGEGLGSTPDTPQQTKIKMFNPKIGRYQVTVTIGPSYATKRIEAEESQMDFIRAVPQVGPIIADIIAKNSDWAGAEEIAARIAKTQDPKLLQPNRDDMSPQVQALIQGLQGQLQQQALQLQAMAKEAADREKDRQVILHQINSKHEADLIKIAAQFQEKMEATAAKRDATLQGTIGRSIADLAKTIQKFQNMSPSIEVEGKSAPAGNAGSSLPPSVTVEPATGGTSPG